MELDSSPNDFDPSISYDGSKVAFARLDPSNGTSDIYVVDSDGSNLKLLASGDAVNKLDIPTFSPDGATIAYSCGQARSGAPANRCGPLADGTYRDSGVMLMNTDGSNQRLILSSSAPASLSWSPDGKWLTTVQCVTSNCLDQVFAYHTDGTDVFDSLDRSRQLTTGDNWPTDPQFSLDGSQILYYGYAGSNEANYLVKSDGTQGHALVLPSGIFPFSPPFTYVPPAGGAGPPPTVNPTQATVPSVQHLGLARAKSTLGAVRLGAKVTGRRYSAVMRNHVIAQYPKARARVSIAGRRPRVRLVLSRGRRPR